MSVELKVESGLAEEPAVTPGGDGEAARQRRPFPRFRSEQLVAAGRPLSRVTRAPKDLRELIRMVKLENPLVDVLRNSGVQLRRTGNTNLTANCPFPNHSDSSPSFKIKLGDLEHFRCYGCDASGDVFDFLEGRYGLRTLDEKIRFLMGKGITELKREWNSADAEERRERMRAERERYEREEARRREEDEERWRAAPDFVCAKTYEAMMGLLTLDDGHREDLRGRGLSEEEIEALGYRTLPVERAERIRLCEELVAAGCRLRRVPGFFRIPEQARDEELRGRWCFGGTRWGEREIVGDLVSIGDDEDDVEEVLPVRGMLIPTRDPEGRTVRLEMRNDPPPEGVSEEVRKRFPPKYVSCSSRNRPGGASSGVVIHYAGPIYGGEFPGVLWVTEGRVKADISALRLRARVAGAPGVAQAAGAIEAAKAAGYYRLHVAMDMEAKDHVHLATARLCRQAEEAGLEARVVVWAPARKGLDDCLVAGGGWGLLTPDEWWETLSDASQDYVAERFDGAPVALGPAAEVPGEEAETAVED